MSSVSHSFEKSSMMVDEIVVGGWFSFLLSEVGFSNLIVVRPYMKNICPIFHLKWMFKIFSQNHNKIKNYQI